MEFTLLYAAVTGFAFAWGATRLLQRTGRIPPDIDKPFDVLLAGAVTGLFVGRLAAMILTGVNPITNPADILLVRGGVDTGFASLAALGAVAWTTRPAPLRAADALAPAALVGLAGWQAGCLWRDACLGTASSLPWAYAQAGSDVTRHPTELYAALLFLLAAVAVARAPARPGLAAGAALASAAAIRLVTQPLRPSLAGGPVAWYVASIVAGTLIAVLGPRIGRAGEGSDTG